MTWTQSSKHTTGRAVDLLVDGGSAGSDAYAAWSLRLQRSAESKLVCERDRLPELGVVDISSYAPFLSLDEPEAARWLVGQR